MQIKIIIHHRGSHGTYGSLCITANLREAGTLVSVNTVAAHMRPMDLSGISPRTFKVTTTTADYEAVFPPDLVDRKFDQRNLNAVWTSDITYLAYGSKLAFLCTIRDEHSRRVLNFATADHMSSELVVQALQQAVFTRKYGCAGTIFHTYRGSQFTSKQFMCLLLLGNPEPKFYAFSRYQVLSNIMSGIQVAFFESRL